VNSFSRSLPGAVLLNDCAHDSIFITDELVAGDFKNSLKHALKLEYGASRHDVE
jgi:hypothetical protein